VVERSSHDRVASLVDKRSVRLITLREPVDANLWLIGKAANGLARAIDEIPVQKHDVLGEKPLSKGGTEDYPVHGKRPGWKSERTGS